MTRRIAVLVLVVAATLISTTPADAAPGGLKYVRSKWRTVQPLDVVRQRVSCPARSVVVSGGVETMNGTPGSSAIVTSAPFDNRDRGRRPDNGWLGAVKNLGPDPHTMRAHAVCATSGKYAYVALTFDASSGVRTDRGVLCPETMPVVGGGALLTGNDVSLELASSSPLDHDDGDLVRDDGWFAEGNNTSSVTEQLTVYAICAKSGTYSYVTPSPGYTIGPQTSSSTGVDCNPGSILIGGGVLLSGTSTDIELMSIQPYDGSDDDTRPDDGSSSIMWNGSNSTITYAPTSICKVL